MHVLTKASDDARKGYWSTLSLTLMVGFILNIAMIKFIPVETVMQIGTLTLIIGYIIFAIAGIFICHKAKSTPVVFLGYLMVVVPLGVILIPFVASLDPGIPEKAAFFTAGLTLMMTIGARAFPVFFRSIGGILMWGLIAAIIAQVIMYFLHYHLSVMDWIVALIFMGLIGYDYAMALEDEPTTKQAIVRALALYLNIVNLFMRVSSILNND
jgi:FtsH-binding integral membrane protein